MAYSRYRQPFLILILKGCITTPEQIRIFQIEERGVHTSEQHTGSQVGGSEEAQPHLTVVYNCCQLSYGI